MAKYGLLANAQTARWKLFNSLIMSMLSRSRSTVCRNPLGQMDDMPQKNVNSSETSVSSQINFRMTPERFVLRCVGEVAYSFFSASAGLVQAILR